MSNKPPFKGHASYASSVETTNENRNYGPAPRAGQSKPYVSGSNARNVQQRPKKGPAAGSSGVGPASQPRQPGYRGR